MTRRIDAFTVLLAALLVCGVTLAPVQKASAQPKPVVVVQSGEAATLDWRVDQSGVGCLAAIRWSRGG